MGGGVSGGAVDGSVPSPRGRAIGKPPFRAGARRERRAVARPHQPLSRWEGGSRGSEAAGGLGRAGVWGKAAAGGDGGTSCPAVLPDELGQDIAVTRQRRAP